MVLDAATAADLMAPNPVSISAGASVREATAFLADKGFSAAPVIDEAGRPVGVLSQSDILMHDRESGPNVSGDTDYYKGFDLRPLSIIRTDVVGGVLTKARDIMTPIVFSIGPDTPACKVIEEMLTHRIHRLFVVDSDGVLIGTVRTVDVLQHLRAK